MDPLPADWRTFGEHPTGAPRSAEPASKRSTSSFEGTVASTHRWVAIGLLLAGVAGLLGVAAVAWASQPAEVIIDGSEVAFSGGNAATLNGSAGVASPAPTSALLVATDVIVDVQGAVMRPGLQRLQPGMRVGDAIAAAGGFSPQVDAAGAAANLNLAEPLIDGVKVHVPARGATPPISGGPNGGTANPSPGGLVQPTTGTGSGGLIDLNLADSALLDTLPGIGPVTAAAIIAAREVTPFQSVEDLRTRGVVGPATYEGIRTLVAVGG
jgi:competence protein ComEA